MTARSRSLEEPLPPHQEQIAIDVYESIRWSEQDGWKEAGATTRNLWRWIVKTVIAQSSSSEAAVPTNQEQSS